MSEVSAIVYTLDDYTPTAIGVAAPEANGPAYLERTFLSLDMVEGIELRDYKTLQRVEVTGRVIGDTPIMIRVATVDAPGETFSYGLPEAYDGHVKTRQLYFRASGRYHAIRFDYTGVEPIRINRYDIEITFGGRKG